MMRRMAKKHARGAWLITGAASGFGRELARRLSARGERLWLWDRNEAALSEVALELGGDVHLEVVDVTDAAAVERATESSAEAAGPLGHVVSCAGILRVGDAEAMAAADYHAMMAVNYLGSVHVALSALPLLRAAGRPGAEARLVLVASVAGLRGFPQLAGYSASKFAILGFAQALRDELVGSGVDLRVLCPPPGDTPMVRDLPQVPPVYKLSRLFTAEEVVEALLRGLERSGWIILVDVGSKAMWRVGRTAPGLLDRIVRWASD